MLLYFKDSFTIVEELGKFYYLGSKGEYTRVGPFDTYEEAKSKRDICKEWCSMNQH
jgi:hypothetical protein